MKDRQHLDALARQEAANREIIAALGQLSRDVQAPPDFVARVLAKADHRPEPRPGPLAWLRHGWSPTWATALALGLLLSVGMNTWLGVELLQRRQPVQTPPRPSGDSRQERPLETGPFTVRGAEPEGSLTRESTEEVTEAIVVEELRRLTVAHYRETHYAQAITAATAALVLDANAAVLHFYRGMAYEASGDRGQAIPDLQRAARRGHAEAQLVLRTWGVDW